MANIRDAGSVIGEYLLQIPITQEERDQMQAEFFEKDLEIVRATEELDRAKERFKELTKIPKQIMAQLRGDLRNGFTEKTVRAYEHIDDEEEVVEYYEEDNNTGVPVLRRPMTPKEKRDLRIMFSKKKNQYSE